ncbi:MULTISPECIES: DUF4919 domain-containing protein [Burkholderiaceae]|uniref:DUF4919 domain-containing protein n=1 Tax=Burkholderiaceae TaxID=119060 RepID=UPI0015903D3B|nr:MULTISPECIES: DUF4919 domain-containing protein [Burkholderiaceae]
MQSQRQAFAQDEKIDLEALSREIQATVKESEALDQAGNDTGAISRLRVLEKYAPLPQFPSYDVQMECAKLYAKLAKQDDAEACRQRAVALADILKERTGSGATPDDPVRVITINEVTEWLRSQSLRITGLQTYPYHNENLQVVSYTGPSTVGKSPVAYFLLNSRIVTSLNKKAGIYDPLPVSAKDGKYYAALQQAHEARVRFLNDKSFNYGELAYLCTNSERDALQLAQQGDINGALAKIREVEKIRPIQDIPITDFIAAYSFLLGKSGDVETQMKMRLYLFGINQDIAHSGNGLSQDTAVHIVATSEEYAWVRAKNLRVTRQQLVQNGESRYDLLDAVDASGHSQTFYFEVTQVFNREIPVAAQ